MAPISDQKRDQIYSESKLRRLKTAKLGQGLDDSDMDSENHEIKTKKTEKSVKSQNFDPTP